MADPFDVYRDQLRGAGAGAGGAYDAEVRARVAQMQAARAAAPASAVAAPAAIGALYKAGRLAGRAVGAVGRTLRSPISIAALAPTAAGILASKAAGGTVGEGADPDMFARALGEGYARLAPEFMGGLPRSAVDAGDTLGASDIENRLSAPLVADATVLSPAENRTDLQLLRNRESLARGAGARATAPALDPLTTQFADSKRADVIIGEVDRMVGRGGAFGDPNARLRNIAAAPGAIEKLNEVQRLNRTGIQATRDANGRLVLSNAPGAEKPLYPTADGGTTTEYTKSTQYAQGVELAARERGQLAAIESRNALEEKLGAVQRAKTVTGKNIALRLYEAEVGRQTEAAKLAAGASAAGQKTELDRARLMVDYMTAKATGDEKAADTALKNIMAASAASVKARGGTPEEVAATAKGQVAQPRFIMEPSLSPDVNAPRVVMNARTGALETRTPQRPVTELDIQTTMTKHGMTREQVVARLKAEGRM